MVKVLLKANKYLRNNLFTIVILEGITKEKGHPNWIGERRTAKIDPQLN